MKFNKVYFYPISVFLGFLLYFLLFNLNIVNPDYSFGNPQLCVELVEYQLKTFDSIITYPFSCDQNFYYTGFENFSKVFEETYNYQARPLYILGGYLSFKITNFFNNIFNLNSDYVTQFSTYLYQLLIINSIVYIFYISIKEKVKISNFDYLVILTIIMINPIYKWGMFVPSHQSATLLLIVFFIYFSSKEGLEVNYKISLIFGLFFLFHRSFLISFLGLILYKNLNRLFRKDTYIKNTINLLYFLLPNILYESFIRFVLQRSTYDANTEYWGQFVWLYDFIRGKVRYQSEWHCVTIPENFICYLTDFSQMILYILFPIILLLLLFLINYFVDTSKKYPLINQALFISFSLFLFWSLIGWYPPIRFNFYSLGHLMSILFVLVYVSEKQIVNKILIVISLTSAYLFIPHWNSPNISFEFGLFQLISFFCILLYCILKILQKQKL